VTRLERFKIEPKRLKLIVKNKQNQNRLVPMLQTANTSIMHISVRYDPTPSDAKSVFHGDWFSDLKMSIDSRKPCAQARNIAMKKK
jgi:hypothetical protein